MGITAAVEDVAVVLEGESVCVVPECGATLHRTGTFFDVHLEEAVLSRETALHGITLAVQVVGARVVHRIRSTRVLVQAAVGARYCDFVVVAVSLFADPHARGEQLVAFTGVGGGGFTAQVAVAGLRWHRGEQADVVRNEPGPARRAGKELVDVAVELVVDVVVHGVGLDVADVVVHDVGRRVVCGSRTITATSGKGKGGRQQKGDQEGEQRTGRVLHWDLHGHLRSRNLRPSLRAKFQGSIYQSRL